MSARSGCVLALTIAILASCTDQVPTEPGGRTRAYQPQLSSADPGTVPTSGAPGVGGSPYIPGPYSTNNPQGEGGTLIIVNLASQGGMIYVQDHLTGHLFPDQTLHYPQQSPTIIMHSTRGTKYCVFAISAGVEDPNDRGICYAVLPHGFPTSLDYTAFWSGGVSKRAPSYRQSCHTLLGRSVCFPERVGVPRFGPRPPGVVGIGVRG